MGLFSKKHQNNEPKGWEIIEQNQDTKLVRHTSLVCPGLERTVVQRMKHGDERYYCGACEQLMPIAHFPH